MNTVRKVLGFIDGLNDWIGKILSFGALCMFLLVMKEVIGRYFFNHPTVWGNELTQLIFGVYIVLSGGYVLRWEGHVNVDIIYSRFFTRTKAVVDIFTSILFFLFCGMMIYYGGSLAWESIAGLEHSHSAWDPPIYPVKIMIPVGAFLLLLQGTAKLIRDIITAVTGKEVTIHANAEG